MAIKTRSSTKHFAGTSMDPFRIGKPVGINTVKTLSDSLNSLVQLRRSTIFTTAYQVGNTELVSPTRINSTTTNPGYSIKFLAGPNTRYAWVSAILLGASSSTSASVKQQLGFMSNQTGSALTFGSVVRTSSSLKADNSLRLEQLSFHNQIVPVDSASVGTMTVYQNITGSAVRVLSLYVTELPNGVYDAAYDTTVGFNPFRLMPGREIDQQEFQDLAKNVNKVRRLHKKQLWSMAKTITTDNTAPAYIDMFTKMAQNTTRLRWDLYPSVELANQPVSVSCGVYAKCTSTGSVRFRFNRNNINITVSGSTPSYFEVTGAINPITEVLSLGGRTDSGLLTIYGAWVYERQSKVFSEFEEGLIEFNNEDSKTFNFVNTFSTTPVVVYTPETPALANTDNINIFSQWVTPGSASVELSALYSGSIRYRAIFAAGYPANCDSAYTSSFTAYAGSPSITDDIALTASYPLLGTPDLFLANTLDSQTNYMADTVLSSTISATSAVLDISAPLTDKVDWIGFKT